MAGSPCWAIAVYRPHRQGIFPSGRPLKRCSVSAVMAVVTSLASVPSPLVRRRLKRTPFTTRGVSHFACARYWPSAALTSTVRCCTAGGITLFRVPDCGSKRAPLSTMASFSGTCCTAVMAKVPSVFSRMETQRNRRRRSDGRVPTPRMSPHHQAGY